LNAAHVYGNATQHTVTLTVNDETGKNPAVQQFKVQVNDVAPTITTNAPSNSLNEGSTLSTGTIVFTDPTFAESDPKYVPTFSYTINWGDGTSSSGQIAAASIQVGAPGVLTQGTLSLSHLYGVVGTYNATITITDAHGGAIIQPFQVIALDVL